MLYVGAVLRMACCGPYDFKHLLSPLEGDVQNTIVIDLSVMIGEAYREQFVSSSTLVMCGRFMGGLGRSFGLPQLFLAS